jgi:hypothetical protein
LRTFVDEDTGEVVSIERNEVILERDVLVDEDEIIEEIRTAVDKMYPSKEDIEDDYTIIYNTLTKRYFNSEAEAVQISTVSLEDQILRMMKQPAVSLINCSSPTNVTISEK